LTLAAENKIEKGWEFAMKLIQTDETRKELTEQIKALYIQAFPESERKPYALMEEKQREGKMQIWAIVEEEKQEFCGLAITILYKEMVLLDYFAIQPEKRGSGVGSEVFHILKEMYADKCFFLEIESTNENIEKLSKAEYQMRRRRKQFYYNNGMKDTGIEVVLFGTQMEILTAGRTVDYEEYHRLYQDTFGKKTAAKVECAGR